jgi:hypothetical protein
LVGRQAEEGGKMKRRDRAPTREAPSMKEEIEQIKRRLNQLMGLSLAQGTLIRIVAGQVALGAGDWWGMIDNIRLMAEHNLQNLVWEGTESDREEVRSDALEHVRVSLDDLLDALLE